MRYTNGGYIGSGYSPQASGDVDGIWRYYSDITRAIKYNNWYVAQTPTNVVVSPSTLSGADGQEATLAAGFDDDPQGYVETFQWQTSLDNSTWSDISGENNNTLIFNLSESDDGSYRRYKITRGFKSIFSSSCLVSIVNETITISLHPSNATVYAGETTSFMVTASVTGGVTLNYQWQLSIDGGSSWNNINGANSATLSVTPPYSYNGYKYRCYITATGAQPAISNSATLTVNENTITISYQPANQACDQQGPANYFYVQAGITNDALLSYKWYKSSNNNDWVEITESDINFYGYNTNNLTVECDQEFIWLKCLVYWSIITEYTNVVTHDPGTYGQSFGIPSTFVP